MKIKNILLLIAFVFLNCKDNKLLKFEPNNPDFQYNGRHEFLENDVALISPGASVSVNFLGNYCKVYLKGEKQPYNYVSFEIDGEYLGRIKIESDSIKEYVININ